MMKGTCCGSFHESLDSAPYNSPWSTFQIHLYFCKNYVEFHPSFSHLHQYRLRILQGFRWIWNHQPNLPNQCQYESQLLDKRKLATSARVIPSSGLVREPPHFSPKCPEKFRFMNYRHVPNNYFIPRFSRWRFFILLMEEILHHLGCIKPYR